MSTGPSGRLSDSAGRYPPLADYGLIGDRRSAALVSRSGPIDWCCLPRFDSEALFARLLDCDHGGHCSFEAPGAEARHRYLDETLVLETRLAKSEGEARILNFFARPVESAGPRIVRIVEGCGVAGSRRLRGAPLRLRPGGSLGPRARTASSRRSAETTAS